MNKPIDIFKEAAEVAASTGSHDRRSYLLAAMGQRKDGAWIKSANGAVSSSVSGGMISLPHSHAEVRALRKLGRGAPALYVVRLLRKDGAFANARPCYMCATFLRSYRVERVYFTIDSNTYGLWEQDRPEKVFEF
jgi:tRNA(Arg) A34 adenosine deaminase TadA